MNFRDKGPAGLSARQLALINQYGQPKYDPELATKRLLKAVDDVQQGFHNPDNLFLLDLLAIRLLPETVCCPLCELA
jgi:hypothetical protein